MTASNIHKDRRLLPRWRYSNDVVPTAEYSGSPTHENQFNPDPSHLESKLNNWNHSKSIGTAADALECGIVLGEFSKIVPVAEYLIKHQKNVPSGLLKAAHYSLDHRPGKQFHLNLEEEPKQNEQDIKMHSESIIREAKRKTHIQPRNAMAWMDMSRAYAVLGQEYRSIHAMGNAMRTAPNHRYILRSASRLLVHFEEHEFAHRILLKNERSKHDPWLIAAEIAVALTANRTPTLVKYGKNFLDSKGFQNIHATELLSSLGTLNFYEGNTKLAKRHIQASLGHPTENAVAQASWVYAQLGMKGVSDSVLKTPKSYEARCLSNSAKHNWKQAEYEAYKWLLDEPYSTRAAENASFICLSLTDNFDLGEKTARIGVQAYPEGPLLINNLAVALAYQGKISEAIREFNKIQPKKIDHDQLYVYVATAGLLSFRSGDAKSGKQFYEMAENMASSEAKSRVLAFRAREEFKLGDMEAGKIVEKSLKLAKGVNDKITQQMLRNLVSTSDQKESFHRSSISNVLANQTRNPPESIITPPLLFKLKD